jgi:5-methylcytosine-specific restriction endonuclease McrA
MMTNNLRPPVACPRCGRAKPCECAEKPTAPRQPVSKFKSGKLDEIDKLYRRAQWQRTSQAIRNFNPICQVIFADGRRCANPSTAVHHITSPRVDLSKFFDAANLIAICEHCHDNSKGEAADSNRTFAPTRFRILYEEVFYEHGRPAPLKPGEVRIGPNGTATVG